MYSSRVHIFFQIHYLRMLFLLLVLAFKMPLCLIFLLKKSSHIFRQIYSVYELLAVIHVLNMTLLPGSLLREVCLNISIPKIVVLNKQLHCFNAVYFQEIPGQERAFSLFQS